MCRQASTLLDGSWARQWGLLADLWPYTVDGCGGQDMETVRYIWGCNVDQWLRETGLWLTSFRWNSSNIWSALEHWPITHTPSKSIAPEIGPVTCIFVSKHSTRGVQALSSSLVKPICEPVSDYEEHRIETNQCIIASAKHDLMPQYPKWHVSSCTSALPWYMNLVMNWPLCSLATSVLKSPVTVFPKVSGLNSTAAISKAIK